MCSDKDCRIFKGTITACDECERNNNIAQSPSGMSEDRASGSPNT